MASLFRSLLSPLLLLLLLGAQVQAQHEGMQQVSLSHKQIVYLMNVLTQSCRDDLDRALALQLADDGGDNLSEECKEEITFKLMSAQYRQGQGQGQGQEWSGYEGEAKAESEAGAAGGREGNRGDYDDGAYDEGNQGGGGAGGYDEYDAFDAFDGFDGRRPRRSQAAPQNTFFVALTIIGFLLLAAAGVSVAIMYVSQKRALGGGSGGVGKSKGSKHEKREILKGLVKRR